MSISSLQEIFEKSMPENPDLSWKPMKHSPSFTEIFGELHFNESPLPSPNVVSSSPFSDNNTTTNQTPSPPITPEESFSPLSLTGLRICTDRSIDFETSNNEVDQELKTEKEEVVEEEEKEKKDLGFDDGKWLWKSNNRSSSIREREYPPPISCIGRNGRLCVNFKCYRNNGRLVVKEIRIPTQDFLRASREDGRLKMHFVQSDEDEDEDFFGESDEEDGEDEEEDYNSLESLEGNHGSTVTDQESKEIRD